MTDQNPLTRYKETADITVGYSLEEMKQNEHPFYSEQSKNILMFSDSSKNANNNNQNSKKLIGSS
jgi:hypothetical protein